MKRTWIECKMEGVIGEYSLNQTSTKLNMIRSPVIHTLGNLQLVSTIPANGCSGYLMFQLSRISTGAVLKAVAWNTQ
jgi:hypothetical protein